MGHSKVLALSAALGWTLVACGGAQKPVAPDSKSGTDASWKAPAKLDLDSDTRSAQAADTVSYPGGDRTDWRRMKLSVEADLTFTLNVTPSKPGLDVQLKVLDEDYHVKGTGVGERGGRKKVVVKKAGPGKYYVVVYAPDVGDAGAYKLKVKMKPIPPPAAPDAPVVEAADVPMPDRLAAIPPANAKSGSSGPRPPRPPKPPKDDPPPKVDPPPDTGAKTIKASIIDIRAGGSGTILIINKGTAQGLAKGTKGSIVNKAGKSVGSATIVSASETSSTAETSASMDVIGDGAKVTFKGVAPPAEGGGDGG